MEKPNQLLFVTGGYISLIPSQIKNFHQKNRIIVFRYRYNKKLKYDKFLL